MTLETISVNNIIRKKKKNLRQISPTFEKNTTYITRHALSHEGQCQVSKTSRVSPISIIVRQTGQNYAKNAMCSTITQQKHTRYETTLWYTPPQHYPSRCGPRVPGKKNKKCATQLKMISVTGMNQDIQQSNTRFWLFCPHKEGVCVEERKLHFLFWWRGLHGTPLPLSYEALNSFFFSTDNRRSEHNTVRGTFAYSFAK